MFALRVIVVEVARLAPRTRSCRGPRARQGDRGRASGYNVLRRQQPCVRVALGRFPMQKSTCERDAGEQCSASHPTLSIAPVS